MKLSNKILLAFFGFIFLYLTAAFVEIRLTGSVNILNDSNSKAETVDLLDISYLIIDGIDKDVNVIGSDRTRLEVRSISGDWLKKLKYTVSGDTLRLSGLESTDSKTLKITVFVPQTNLKGIAVKGSTASLRALQPAMLTISQNSGSIWMNDCRISKIEMVVDKSRLYISGSTIDTVSATIERSTVNISSPLLLLQGSMKDKSLLEFEDVQEIQLKKDESSRLNIFKNSAPDL